ncbi:glycoprotein-N-acetylgalactosamine 3-beta-galactosyltransferase 1-like [Dreissena polymorpha]|uniref:glycoprotein-N-acetylgalactosamine 3-beta-galactosyltransferase 1-like n=1 Tax=Dreissena polymorpha TaxID=45954 RepID=UPI00226432D5|nr:glycoprotein-N-acetylgalactosamine 3-beta-galactosyltransferase 1-like [Dreissena polymorpha]
MQSATKNLSKYAIISFLLILIVVMGVYFIFSNRIPTPSLAIGIDVGIQHKHVPVDDIPLTHVDIYVDDTVARKLFDEVRVFCWILTTKSGTFSKAAGINATWAPRCNKHVFFASASGEESIITHAPLPHGATPMQKKEYKTATGNTFKTVSMGTDIMFIDTQEGYDNLTEKFREILQLLNLQEMEHFDWFLKADDDTYVIMENMRFLLKGLNPETPAYLGYQLEPT